MSRKRRKRPAVGIVPQKPVESTASADDKPVVGRDGYVNSLAYLGEASPLSQANDYERHSISNDYNLLTILYRENWLAARIIDTPCEDMTRSWYSISSEIDQDRLDELAKLEAKHSVKQEITNAIRWGRLYGGAAAVMVIKGQEDILDEPLDYDMLQPGCFRGLIVIDKVRGIFPSLELEEDMDDPEFGYPKWYQVTLNEESGEIIRIHHSRLLLFRGRQLPIDEEINQDYWGASELEHVYEELQKRNSSSANIAQLIFQANVAALKISDYGEVMGMGTEAQKRQVYNYVSEMNRLRTSFGITLMGNEDNYEQHPYSFAGVAEVYETFMMDMAGAAEIPATKLFGRAPQGMNATGESDMKNYYEVIGQLQERILKPALEKLLPVMCMSLWGEVPQDMEIVFEPLGTTTPSERAEIMGQAADPIINAFSAGLISQRTALKELREVGKPINAWTNITDEDIEKADDEVDQGEAMANPMGMPPGMPGMEGMEAGGMPPEGEIPPEGMPEQEVDMDKVHELKERIHSMRFPEAETGGEIDLEKVRELKSRIRNLREAQEEPEDNDFDNNGEIQVGLEYGDDPVEDEIDVEKVRELKGRVSNLRQKQKIDELRARIERLKEKACEDGGPGSGPRPGYHKKSAGNVAQQATKPGLLQRARFMLNPTAGMRTPKDPVRTAQSVAKANREREQWNNLSLTQKVRGNAAQERHMRRVKAQVAKAAAKGDIEKARQIVKQNRHYWSNDPASTEKVQSETLKRQKAAKSGFLHDALTFLREQFDGGPGSGNHGHAGRPGQRGGSAPGGGGGASSSKGASNKAYHDNLRAEAIKKFGTTDNRSKAGYLLPDGKMLNFGRNGFGSGYDHRDIDQIYGGAKKGTEAMLDFMSGGNIRMIADAPGISLVGGTEVTPEQGRLLEQFIDSAGYDSNRFYVDIFNKDGSVAKSLKFSLMRDDPEDIVSEIAKETKNAYPVDNSPPSDYNGYATKGWQGLKTAMKVGGPKAARKFIKDYFAKNPDVAQEATKYMDVRSKVDNFLKDHPEAKNFNTYDKDGKLKDVKSGFCVTFHQNNAADDPLGGYTNADYAAMCAIAMKELGADEVNIGYYGNPEVSFVCQDEATAKRFAVEHNQQSVYNANTGRTLVNKNWRKDLNPIRL